MEVAIQSMSVIVITQTQALISYQIKYPFLVSYMSYQLYSPCQLKLQKTEVGLGILYCLCSKESPSALNSTGFWNFYCEDGSTNGTVSVVPGLHIISVTMSIPHDCYAIGTGDVVLWVLDGGNRSCEKKIIIESDDGEVFTANFTGKALTIH